MKKLFGIQKAVGDYLAGDESLFRKRNLNPKLLKIEREGYYGRCGVCGVGGRGVRAYYDGRFVGRWGHPGPHFCEDQNQEG